MKKLLGIVVLGLLKYHPIDYGRTITGLLHREIKNYSFINEKTFRDRGSGYVVMSIIGASLNVF